MAREKHPPFSSKENFLGAGQYLRGVQGRFFKLASFSDVAAYSPQALYELQAYGRLRMMHLYEGGKYRFGDGSQTAPPIAFVSSTGLGLRPSSSNVLTVVTGGVDRWSFSKTVAGRLVAEGNYGFSHGTSALATSATEGFIFLQSAAGHPTGTPVSIPTAQKPLLWDSTDAALEIYDTKWREITPLTSYKGNDETRTNDTLTADGALVVNVRAAGKYRFRFVVFTTYAAGTGGVKLAVNGTCTITDLKAHITLLSPSGGVMAHARVTALGSTVGAATGTGNSMHTIEGSMEVNAAGTFRLDWAQNVTDANGLTVQKTSYMEVVRLT